MLRHHGTVSRLVSADDDDHDVVEYGASVCTRTFAGCQGSTECTARICANASRAVTQPSLASAGFADTLQDQFISLQAQSSSELASQLSGLSSTVSNLGVLCWHSRDTIGCMSCQDGTSAAAAWNSVNLCSHRLPSVAARSRCHRCRAHLLPFGSPYTAVGEGPPVRTQGTVSSARTRKPPRRRPCRRSCRRRCACHHPLCHLSLCQRSARCGLRPK